MRKIVLVLLSAVAIAWAKGVAIGPQLSLKHDSNDRYIDGYAVLVSTPISGRMDLFVHAASHSWRTGVERTSPSHAHEFFYDESTWLLGLRYWFRTQSAVKPYLHLMVGKYFDTIHYHTTTYDAPFYGLAAEHTSTSKENGSDTGLGFGVAFLIMSHLFFDMSITSHAATQLNSHVVLLAGLSYHIGF